ncbi:MAG: hypothetical protein GDA35_06765 [Hyphomonadaceae bacterium]|nr:hypothetical protein [Hyphomonadaceae bacterium]
MEIGLFAAIGFLFAAYAVVGNDALQTLGTFINSNARLHWFWLFLFAGFILVATFTYGWIINDGDPSWGRLSNTEKYPVVDIQWYHTLPPLALLVITRFGVPVSTSFMVLTVFATVGGLTSMLMKSLIGYLLAFVVGLLVYLVTSRTLEKFFREHEPGAKAPWGLASIMGALIGAFIYLVPPLINPEISYLPETAFTIFLFGVVLDIVASVAVLTFDNPVRAIAASILSAALIGFVFRQLMPGQTVAVGIMSVLAAVVLYLVATRVNSGRIVYWIILQWVTTGYLWGVWLIQDFANIFVFLPRELSVFESFAAMFSIIVLLGYTFWNRGGPVQRILQAKTAVTDIRSATVIDFIYASLLFLFKEVSDIPMSTTFVFLGLIAGREYGFTLLDKSMDLFKACRLSLSDASKAFIGLAISINMAVFLPRLAAGLSGVEVEPVGQSYLVFIALVNLLLVPVGWYLMKQASKPGMAVTGGLLAMAAAAFFIMPPG